MPTDPRGLRGSAPLLDAWLRFQEAGQTPFTIPGHKQRTDLVGDVVAGDVPLYAGFDTMKLGAGVLADAESRAAAVWGADVCRFSTGGSTHANQALALAVAGDGDEVVVSRTLHRSVLLGLVPAGLSPIWVRPEVDAATGLPLGVPPAAVEAALRRHPRARAVFAGDPSYVGTIGDVAGLADVAHALAASIERRRGEPRPIVGPASYRVDPVTVVPPRTAFFAHAETVPIAAAAGRTSAELIAPYPPGIPVLAPGEQVTPRGARGTRARPGGRHPHRLRRRPDPRHLSRPRGRAALTGCLRL